MRTTLLLAMLLAACGATTTATPAATPGPKELTPEAPALEACADAPLLGFAELAAGQRAGERVAVDGVPTPEVACTLLYCEPQCCNACGGNYALLSTDDHRVRLSGLPGCSGNECAIHCEPFGRAPTHAYRFVGVHRHRKQGETSVYAESTIEVERYCALPATP